MDMIELELAEVSRQIVEQLMSVRPDEEVLVISDPTKASVGRALTNAARATGSDAHLILMPQLASHGNEPTDVVAEAMMAADVILTATTHAITHTHARLNATAAGARTAILRGVTEEMMIEGGMSTDFEKLRENTTVVRNVLDTAEEAEVRSPTGTDIWIDLSGRDAFSLDGFYHDNYGFATLPPGEAPTSPAEGTATGTIVIDYSMDNIGRLDEPIELTFEEGHATAISGGADASRLRTIVEKADENAGNLAEFAIGTNPDARLVGNLAEDKKRAGTTHFAIGDNESLGGSLQSDIHLDGLVLEPTVWLDGEVVLEEGTLLMDRIRNIADN